MSVKSTAAQSIDPDAVYSVHVTARFQFEGIEFAPLYEIAVAGALLKRMLADEAAKTKIRDFKKKD